MITNSHHRAVRSECDGSRVMLRAFAVPHRRMTTLARWVSILGHPFVMVAAMVTGAALHSRSPGQAARIVPIVMLITVVPVAILMMQQVRRGAWQDADGSDPRNRPLLFVISALGVVGLLAYLGLTQPQSFVIRGAAGTLAVLIVSAAATRWLKVSLHLAFATLAATVLLRLDSTIGWILVALLPMLAWSRLFLARHSGAEVIVGLLIGLAAGVAILRL
jgi:membrane-associated phospholipid phosphatase